MLGCNPMRSSITPVKLEQASSVQSVAEAHNAFILGAKRGDQQWSPHRWALWVSL